MPIDLSSYEAGVKFDGTYDKALALLQKRLAELQSLHIAHNCRTLIVFEGWDANGQGGIIKRITARLDPRFIRVYPISAANEQEKAKHFLWRFWSKLPAPKDIHLWDHSHYTRVLTERVEGQCSETEWRRGYDEINEFESQQIEIGTKLIKIFLHVTPKTQDKVLQARMDDPSKQWKISENDFRLRSKRQAYHAAVTDMFQFTDTRWAPWKVLDANNQKAAHINALEHIVAELESGLPKDFPKLGSAIKLLAKKAVEKPKANI